MFSRCTSSLWWEYSCRLPYPHFAASAGADVTLLVTKSPFFLFVCFCFLLKTPVSEQSSTEAAGSAVHIPHITVNQGQRFSVEFETRSGEDFVMPAVLTSFGSSASEYFCLLLFTEKNVHNTNSEFGSLVQMVLLYPIHLFYCHYQIM